MAPYLVQCLKEQDIVPLPRSSLKIARYSVATHMFNCCFWQHWPYKENKITWVCGSLSRIEICGIGIESQQQILFCYGYLHGSKKGYLQEHEIVTLPMYSSWDCKILTYYTYVHLLLQSTITIPHTSTLELGISFSHWNMWKRHWTRSLFSSACTQ